MPLSRTDERRPKSPHFLNSPEGDLLSGDTKADSLAGALNGGCWLLLYHVLRRGEDLHYLS